MLIIDGGPALSRFRVEKLEKQLASEVPQVKQITTQWLHFVDLRLSLSGERREVLEKLLEYGPAHESVALGGKQWVVVPRLGTISPWSSKIDSVMRS